MQLHSTVLENGLRVFVHEVPHVRTVTASVWIDHGSQDEPPNKNGINHMAEHLLVKQFDPAVASRQIRELMDLGAQFNGTTTKEFTYYYITVIKDYLERSLQALAGMVMECRAGVEEMNNQRAVVLEEQSMLLGSANQIHERFGQALWGDAGLGQFVIGRQEVIQQTALEDVLAHIDTFYRADNASVVVVGNCRHPEVFALVEGLFGAWRDRAPYAPTPQVMFENNIRVVRTESDQVTLALRVNSEAFHSRDRYAAEILAQLLGGGASSRLFRSVREKHGLAYSVSAYANSYESAGLLCAVVSCNRKAVTEVIRLALNEFSELKAKPVSEGELHSANQALATNAFMIAENTLNLMRLIGRGAMLGVNYSINGHLQVLRNLNPEDIQVVAKRLFRNRNLAVAAIGDVTGEHLLEDVMAQGL